MNRRKTCAVLLFIVFCVLAWGGWRTGLLSRIYRSCVSVGEIPTRQVRGINGHGLPPVHANGFSFVVAGHLYGSQQVDDQQPDLALQHAIPAISSLNPVFFVSLGDMVRGGDADEFESLESALLDRFEFPVFNTVGNHDVIHRDLYEARYGKAWSTFKYGPARFVFLDTEQVPCNLDSTQMAMLQGAVQNALRDKAVRYIFIFMHKTLFFRNAALGRIRSDLAGPNDWICYRKKTFWPVVDELLVPVAAEKPVYLFAGDVGARGNLTPYYERHPDAMLVMLMTGLGDTPRDNLLHVHVDGAGVIIETIFLADFTTHPVEKFDPDYWVDVASHGE
jgi:hypothetical protein